MNAVNPGKSGIYPSNLILPLRCSRPCQFFDQQCMFRFLQVAVKGEESFRLFPRHQYATSESFAILKPGKPALSGAEEFTGAAQPQVFFRQSETIMHLSIWIIVPSHI